RLGTSGPRGGTPLQRPRCRYVGTGVSACNKRAPGSGGAASDGDTRRLAIFGASEHCAATHASDLAVARVALDATAELCGPRGDRTVAIAHLVVLPGDRPDRENVLEPGGLLTAAHVPPTAS